MLLGVDKDIRIYENRTLLPRSFVVHRVRIVGDAQEALAVLHAPDLDLSNEIVLEEANPADFWASPRSPQAAVVASDEGAARGRDGLWRDYSKPLQQIRETVGHDTP
jgi:hypothetical protein